MCPESPVKGMQMPLCRLSCMGQGKEPHVGMRKTHRPTAPECLSQSKEAFQTLRHEREAFPGPPMCKGQETFPVEGTTPLKRLTHPLSLRFPPVAMANNAKCLLCSTLSDFRCRTTAGSTLFCFAGAASCTSGLGVLLLGHITRHTHRFALTRIIPFADGWRSSLARSQQPRASTECDGKSGTAAKHTSLHICRV